MANGLIGKVVVGGIVTTAISLTGWGIVNNDVRNTAEHVEIRKESLAGEEKVLKKVDKVYDIVIETQLEQREMSAYIKGKL